MPRSLDDLGLPPEVEAEYDEVIAEAEGPQERCIECRGALNSFERSFGICDDCAEQLEMRS